MMLWLAAAQAQDLGGFDAHGFSAAGHQGNPAGYLELAYPSAGWKGAWDAGVLFDYADDPLVEAVGDRSFPVLDQVLTANVVGGVSILGYARVDVALPVYPFAIDQAGSFAALGDLRVEGNVPVLTVKDLRPGISILPTIWAPTGADTRFLGDAGFGFGGTVAVAQEIGAFGWNLNVGGRVGPTAEVRNVAWGTGLVGGLGAHYRIADAGSVGVELHATPSFGYSGGQFPMEVLAHGRYRLPAGLYALVGGGAGVTSGVGASRYRVVLGVGWSALGVPPAQDADGDGVLDDIDACRDQAEDRDGWQDTDGCVDPDDDADGVPDTADRCRIEAEDLDQIADADGCPEADGDNDGVFDGTDNCPEAAEDRDGDADDDGCPETEDRADTDGDGVPDKRDTCPNEPIRPGQDPRTSDGCPKLAEITADKIVITDKIYFQEGKSTILPESAPVLDAVVALLREHAEISDLLVEGHTNDIGNDDANYRLSEARAKAVVDWMVNAGIDRNRLTPKGYGETRPIVPNDDDAHRAQNRRVEFTIVKRN